MITHNPYKRRQGRPRKGDPKPPPKPSARMGRPSKWSPSLGLTKHQGITAPAVFFELFKDRDFCKKINDLILDFIAAK